MYTHMYAYTYVYIHSDVYKSTSNTYRMQSRIRLSVSDCIYTRTGLCVSDCIYTECILYIYTECVRLCVSDLCIYRTGDQGVEHI